VDSQRFARRSRAKVSHGSRRTGLIYYWEPEVRTVAVDSKIVALVVGDRKVVVATVVRQIRQFQA